MPSNLAQISHFTLSLLQSGVVGPHRFPVSCLSLHCTLLILSSAKYMQHAGRTGLTVQHAIGVLVELGVSDEELSEYCATEVNAHI